jgi:hypothetical protein
MANYTGVDGAFSFATSVLEITRFECTHSVAIVHTTTSANAGGRTKEAKGLKTWSATITGILNSADTYPNAGDSGAVVLTYASGVTKSGTALVANINEVVDVPGETFVEFTLELEGTGALT